MSTTCCLYGQPEAAPHQVAQHQSDQALNKEVKRRADIMGVAPNEASITRLIGVVRFAQNVV